MKPRGASEYDFGWRRRNLAAMIVLSAASGAVLAAGYRGRVRFFLDPPADALRAEASAELIDPNTASAASLRRLPGIGLVKARAVVAYRTSHGPAPFRGPADLEKVPGIGPGLVGLARPYLTFPTRQGRH